MNKKLNEQQNSHTHSKFWLFGEIVLVGFVALFINVIVMQYVCSNCFFIVFGICIFIWFPALIIGVVLFFIILKTKYEKFITLKSTTIFSVILALVIILPAISFYYETVPQKEVTNQWHYDKDQEICGVFKWMDIHYSTTYTGRFGDFYDITSFEWEYDESTQVITMTGYRNEWRLLLRLDINLITGSHYTMTTYYVSDVNFTLFNPLLFDNTTWKGSLMWDD